MSWIKYLAARLLLLSFSILFTWIMLEIFLRVGFDLIPADAQGVIQHVRRVPWDDEHLVPPFPYIISRQHQARLAPDHDDYPVRWGDARFTFDTRTLWDPSEYGFRTNPPRWPVQIVTLGDSFTFCWTDFEDCWVQRLDSDYHFSVMNLGVPGTGSLAHQNMIEPFVKPLEPEIVIWQWYGNDYMEDYNFAQGLNNEIAPLGVPPGPPPEPYYGKFSEYSAVYRLIRDWMYKREHPPEPTGFITEVNGREMFFTNMLGSYDFSYEAPQYGWQRAEQAILESNTIIREQVNAEMVIILIPTKEEVYADYLADKLDSTYMKQLSEGRMRLLQACETHQWRCVDMTDPLIAAVKEGKNVYHGFDFHLNTDGNAVVADVLANYLIENGLLPAP